MGRTAEPEADQAERSEWFSDCEGGAPIEGLLHVTGGNSVRRGVRCDTADDKIRGTA